MLIEDDMIGKKIKSKYLVEKIIGKGGMGRVYLVKHLKLGNRWAMKVVKKEKGIEKTIKQEAKILEKMNHPNIPHIIDTFSDKEKIYIVETYAEGITLDEKIRAEGKIDEQDAINYFLQLAELLEYLHSIEPYPIVYRDMKPNNVVITHNNRLMLVDFGISKFQKENDNGNTIIAGNRYYSPPEQFDFDLHTDVRADIYSLGMLIIRMITGDISTKMKDSLDDISNIRNELKEILEKCTYKNVEYRYQEISELINDIKYLKDMSNTHISTGRKIIYVDGVKNSGKTFLASQLAFLLAENKISTAVIDLSYDLGIAEYMNVDQTENMSKVLCENNLDIIKKNSYKVGKYITVYKGEILQEKDLIELINKLSKISKVVLIDSCKNEINKIGTYVNDILLVSSQEEKVINVNNKKIVEYLDKDIQTENVMVVVNRYENTDVSKYEILKDINLIPKLFRRKEKFKNITSIRNINREEYLKNTKKKKPLFEEDVKLKEDIKNILNELYSIELHEKTKQDFLKVGVL